MMCSHVKFIISKAAKPSGTVGAFGGWSNFTMPKRALTCPKGISQ